MSDNHAAMCVYCGEAVIYDTREVTDIANAHAKIVEHDQQCPRNPLVARIALLEECNFGLAEESIQQQERIAALEEALEPFANEPAVDRWFAYSDDSHLFIYPTAKTPVGSRFTIGDLRRAAELLKEAT